MKKHTILFLAANPAGTNQLALGDEARAIQVELERSRYRDCFELETRWAAQPLDLLRELRKLKPTVVHFSGHGGLDPTGTGVIGPSSSCDATQRGLFFQGPDGGAQLVTAQALRDTLGAAGSPVKLVVLNACYTDAQAEVLGMHVDCVVGMSASIGDDAARNFAIGFYGGLGERESIAAAFRQGCAAINLEGLRDSARPQLTIRDGVDASRLVLGFPVDAGAESSPRAAATYQTEETPVTRDVLLTRLSRLLPSQFEVVLFRTSIPREYLLGSNAAQASRAVELIHYVEQQNKLEELARIVGELDDRGSAASGRPKGTADPR
jgi:hypothetical protein